MGKLPGQLIGEVRIRLDRAEVADEYALSFTVASLGPAQCRSEFGCSIAGLVATCGPILCQTVPPDCHRSSENVVF